MTPTAPNTRPSADLASDAASEQTPSIEDGSPPNAVVVEVAGADVGLALKEPRGFRFVAADRRFSGLDGRRFGSLRGLQRAARLYYQARKPTGGLDVRSAPGF